MAANSKIEWTEATWNPLAGCSVVSPGCTNCYAMKMAARMEAMGSPLYAGLTRPSKAGPVWTGEVRLAPDATLVAPLRRRKPTTYFVNSMSDLFHESVPDAWIDRIFAVMALSPWHTYQILTKRSSRMRAYLNALSQTDWQARLGDTLRRSLATAPGGRPAWPLPNVWLGVSAEDKRRADERAPDLLATPAAVRFVSAEPLLSEIDFTNISTMQFRGAETLNALTGELQGMFGDPCGTRLPRLDWVIVGSESGPRARSCDLDWVRSIRDQCQAAHVPFFWKQHVENGRKISTPELEGRRWVELPR